ncbi:MAG TPA: GntR family transcriptional regulator [Aliidongia sp.]|uniref:GntR family transcriptional regulator n=1 Tax=Aliidongia sp. TaxID=1914230 RepID=UPI002DDD8D4E|nr:GntR family transcriptional regulator [Aliidongia sp.]HEV2676301.1 GntR family transcriptional regulator [Aliidongia sp.]
MSGEAMARPGQQLKAVLRLRELLLSGEFGPGERVAEIPLAARLSVSRTPLRLALLTLAHEGLLEMLPGGGFVVRDFDPADIADAIELRGVLEGTAARMAAERLTDPADLAPLRAAVEAMEPLVRTPEPGLADFERYVAANEIFHARLLDLAGSPMLRRAMAQAMVLPFASPNSFVLTQADLPESREILLLAQAQHRAILEAIEAREGTRAEALAREHARLAKQNLKLALGDAALLASVPGAALIRRDPVDGGRKIAS